MQQQFAGESVAAILAAERPFICCSCKASHNLQLELDQMGRNSQGEHMLAQVTALLARVIQSQRAQPERIDSDVASKIA